MNKYICITQDTKPNFKNIFARSCFKKFSLKISAPKLWNELPTNITCIPSFPKFKKEVKSYLLNAAMI